MARSDERDGLEGGHYGDVRNGGVGQKKKEKEVCSGKIVRYDVTGAPRTEEQKERMKIKNSHER